jgi:hypothetical protein
MREAAQRPHAREGEKADAPDDRDTAILGPATLLDREEIRHVVAQWALCRDTGRWDMLRSLYTPDATMQTTWCDCAASEFIERSIVSFSKQTKVQHFVGVSAIELRGHRAIAETPVVLLLRAAIGETEVDVTCHGRFYDFFAKANSQWRIHKRIPIYQKDRIDPVDPSIPPKLDKAELAKFAEGYRHLAYVQSLAGATLTKGLIVPGSVEEAELYRKGSGWLSVGVLGAAE